MNITCGQCGKRYKIKAEQAKKAFKTRCKRCSNVIIVRPEDFEQAPSADAPAHQSPAASGQPVDSAPIWFAVINGQQSGPFTVGQLEEYARAGAIESQSYVWCDGMANWSPLAEVSALQSLFSSQTQARPKSKPVERLAAQPSFAEVASLSSEPQPETEQHALSMGVELGHSRELIKEVNAQINTADEGDLMSSVSYENPQSRVGHGEDQSGGKADNPLGQLTNQRNENSVLFSLESIDAAGAIEIQNAMASEPVPSRARNVSNTGGTEGSGLIDLSSLAQLTTGAQTGGQQAINISMGGKGRRGSFTTSSTDLKTIAIAVLSTAMVGVLGLLGYQHFNPAPPPTSSPSTSSGQIQLGSASTQGVKAGASQSTQVPKSSASKPSEVSSVTSAVAAVSSPDSTEDRVTLTRKKKPTPKPKSRTQRPKKPKTRKAKRTSSRTASRTKPKAKPKRSRTGKTSSAADDLLSGIRGSKKRSSSSSLSVLDKKPAPSSSRPKKPPKKAIVSAMKRVNVSRCVSRDPSLKGKGSIKVRIKAVSSGAITNARVTNAPYKSSPVGACIEREVKKQRFPSFSDREISFTFPFRN